MDFELAILSILFIHENVQKIVMMQEISVPIDTFGSSVVKLSHLIKITRHKNTKKVYIFEGKFRVS